MGKILVLILFYSSFYASELKMVKSMQELDLIKKNHSDYIVYIGFSQCIPCEKVKEALETKLIAGQKVFAIDVLDMPKIRHEFDFKALPYMVIYKNGSLVEQKVGQADCLDFISNLEK